MADGVVDIDVKLDLNHIKSDSNELNRILHGLGKGSGENIEKSVSEGLDKSKSKAKQAGESLKDNLNVKGKATVELDDKGAKKGAENVKEAVKGIPKERKTDIKADSENAKSNAERAKNAIKEIPKEHTTDAKVNSAQAEEKTLSVRQKLKAIPKEVRTELIGQAKEAGITNFERILKRLPKKQQVEILTQVQKGKVIDFEELLRRIPARKVSEIKLNDKASLPLKAIKQQAQQTGSRFSHLKQIILGTFAGQAIANGAHALVNALKSATVAGMQYNKQQDTMRTVWKALTNEAPRDGKKLTGFINDISQHSIYAADTIDKMAQSFYHVHSNAGETEKWTKSFVALGSTLHMTNDALAESGTQFAKIVAGGKANAEDMSVMINRFPMFGEALQKATGKSMKQLYAMSAAGKLTAKQFTQALDYLGKKYKGGTQEAMTSVQGMGMYLKSRWSVLTGSIMTSTFKTQKGVMRSIRDLTSDKRMQQYAGVISKALSKMLEVVNSLLKYVNKNHSTIMDIIKNLGTIIGLIGKTVWNAFAGTAKAIARALGLIGPSAKKSHSPLKILDEALRNMAKHKTAIKAVTGAIVGMVAAIKTLSTLNKIVGFAKKTRDSLAILRTAFLKTAAGEKIAATATKLFASPWTWIVIAVGAVVVALVELYKHNKKFRNFVNGIVKSAKKVAKSIGKFFGNIGKDIAKGWKAVTKWFSKAVKSFKKFGSDAIKGLAKGFSHIGKEFSKIGKAIKKAISPVLKAVLALWKNEIKGIEVIWKGLSHIAKKVWGGIGKVITSISRNTRKVASAIFKKLKEFIEDVWDDLKSATKKAWNLIKKFIVDPIKSFYNFGKKWIGKLGDWIGDKWDAIKKHTHKSWDNISDKIHDSVVSSYKSGSKWIGKLKDSMHDRVEAISKHWGKMWGGMSDIFQHVWKLIKGHAFDGMNAVIGIINTGIRGINGIIHTFGGKQRTIGYIGKIHLATGTGAFSGGRRPITKPTLAVLNDGNDSPETGNKEGVWRPSTGEFGVVQGRNTEALLMPGDEVLNASEMREFAKMQGIEHFAKGTGLFGNLANWAGNIGSWIGQKASALKKWFTMATKIVAHPIKALSSVFSFTTKALTRPMWIEIGKGLYKNSRKQANKWWSELWSMASSRLGGGGDASGLLAAVEKYGHGHRYVWGAHGPNVFDCSGLVEYALKKAFGISLPAPSGNQYSMTKAVSNPVPGDLVFFGPGGSEHVGVYAGDGKYYSAMSDSSHPNIGMSPVSSGPGTPHYRRVPGLSHDAKVKGKEKQETGLKGMIKRQVGPGFWKFLNKLGSLFGVDESAGGGIVPSAERKKMLAKAGIPESWWNQINWLITKESGWNPRATNPSSGAYGIPQALPAGKMASAGSDWRTNPITQLKWEKSYIKDRYGGIGNAVAHERSYNWYANGGWASEPSIFGETGEPEVVINPRRPSADELLIEAIRERAKIAPESFTAQISDVINSAKQQNGTQISPIGGRFSNRGTDSTAKRESKQITDLLKQIAKKKTKFTGLVDGKVLFEAVQKESALKERLNNSFTGKRGLKVY